MAQVTNGSRADLHNHTTASDGLLKPAQLVEYAARKGLGALAITDHDTTDGIDEGLAAGKIQKIVVVPGIEINTQLGSDEIHILGYYIDWKSSLLQNLLSEMKEIRKSRAEIMVQKLVALYGFDISNEEVQHQAKDGTVARPHIARVLISKGIVQDVNEAFEKYIGNHCPAYVERYHLTPKEGIQLIHRIGGVAVLAHPGLMHNHGLINDLIKCGIEGIEVYHSRHTLQQTKNFEDIAKQNELLITGGSDCHGELFDGMPIIGDVTVGMEEVKALRNMAARKAMNNCKS